MGNLVAPLSNEIAIIGKSILTVDYSQFQSGLSKFKLSSIVANLILPEA
jgi:hypothetical protein